MHVIEIKKISENKIKNIFNKIKICENIEIDENTEKYIIEQNINQMINSMEKYLLLDMKITKDIAKQFYKHELKDIRQQLVNSFKEVAIHSPQGKNPTQQDLLDTIKHLKQNHPCHNEPIKETIIKELLFTAFFAALFSLPAAYIEAWMMVNVINLKSFGWSMPLIFDWSLIIEAFGLSLLAALLAAIVPCATLFKINIAKALRYE
jgi:DNA polymerase III delta prime subunit